MHLHNNHFVSVIVEIYFLVYYYEGLSYIVSKSGRRVRKQKLEGLLRHHCIF